MGNPFSKDFDEFYLSNYKRLFYTAFRATENYHDSEELVDEACGICTCRFHHMITSSPRKGTWKKTIRFPGHPEKTIIVRME